MNENLDMAEIREKWEEQNKIHRYEGTTGVKNLEKLLGAIGYSEGNYLGRGNELINFLSDNSGAIEAILEWIDTAGEHVPEWKESLSEELDLEEETEED